MNDLLREKRNELMALAGGTLLVCFGLWYVFIRVEYQRLDKTREMTAQVQKKIEIARKNAQLVDQMESELAQDLERLTGMEEKMADGDVYLWIINRLQHYRQSHGIEFVEFDPPQLGDLDVFPKVPYRAAKFAVGGSATYFDFGEFLAEFENDFPNLRIRRLALEPASGLVGAESENRLSFKLEFTMLVRPPAPRLESP